MKNPQFSICIPYYAGMQNADFFMTRCMESINGQDYQDYEIVVTQNGTMAQNINAAIRQATGEIIKLLFMDDFFLDKNSLEELALLYENEQCAWAATGCMHKIEGQPIFNPHMPEWTDDILSGNNHIGSPSVVSFINDSPPLFDENMSWLLDCAFYYELHKRYGEPSYLYDYNVVIGIHSGQATETLSNEHKLKEQQYLNEKYPII